MKRIAVFAMAIVALSSATALAQPTTLPELWTFFGAPQASPPVAPGIRVPGDDMSIPTRAFDAAAGGTVYLPIFTRTLAGNNTATGTQITKFTFQVGGNWTGGANPGITADVVLPAVQGYTLESNVAQGLNTDLGLNGGFPLASGYSGWTVVPGTPASQLMGSNPVNLPTNAGDAYYMGYVAIHVPAGTPLGSLEVRLGNQTANASIAVSAGQNNWAIGWGPPPLGFDTYDLRRRSGTATTPIAGAQGNSASFVADAIINVVPEPGTLGLLALGLLALRRRRAL